MGSDRLADDFSDFIDAAFADELSKQGDGCGREVAQGVSKTRKRKRATPDVDSTCGSKVCKGGKHNKSNQNTTGSSTVRKCGNGNKSNHDATSASKVRKGSKVNESAQACPSNQGQSACNRRVMSAEAKAKRSDNRKSTRSTETANRTKKRHAEKAEGEDRQNEWRTTRTNRKLRRSESDQSLIDGAMASCESIANTMVDDATVEDHQWLRPCSRSQWFLGPGSFHHYVEMPALRGTATQAPAMPWLWPAHRPRLRGGVLPHRRWSCGGLVLVCGLPRGRPRQPSPSRARARAAPRAEPEPLMIQIGDVR